MSGNSEKKNIFFWLFFLLFFFAGGLIWSSSVSASTLAVLYLQFENPKPAEIEVLLRGSHFVTPLKGKPDEKGEVTFLGLPPGSYELLIITGPKEWLEKIYLEPGEFLQVRIRWKDPSASPLIEQYDFASIGAQTVISQRQLSLLPSADNFSSVMENQDLSATTNRIDSGGLWADHPALFSSRGGTSWTQNEFRLNGLNITEPYYGGTPLILPDLLVIEAWRHQNSFHPASATSPGGLVEIETKRGERSLRGGTSFSLIEPWLTSSNITPSLIKEGLKENHTFNHDRKFRFWLSGPFFSRNRSFLFSFLTQDLSRKIADYDGHNRSRLMAATLRLNELTPLGGISFLALGEQTNEEQIGAARKMAQEATLKGNRQAYLGQLFWQSLPSARHSFFSGLSFAFQKTSTSPYVATTDLPCREIFRPRFWQAPVSFGEEEKGHLNFNSRAELLFGSASSSYHFLNFGLDFSYRFFQNRKKIPGLTHLLFLDGQPSLVAFFSLAHQEQEKATDLSFYFQDTWQLPPLIIEAGLKVIMTRGTGGQSESRRIFNDFSRSSPARISWTNWLPRLSLTLPLSQSKRSYLKFYFGQTAHLLPLNYLRWGNPEAEGCLIYRWTDLNGNLKLEEEELGPLLRREGPFFARIDPSLLRPVAAEFALSFVYRLSREFFLSLSGFTRLTRNLVETENIGMNEDDYEKFILEDTGDDRIPGTHDDLHFTIFNRLPRALGRDIYFLTNPDRKHRTSRYRGLDLIILRRFSSSIFYFSFTATEAFGTTSPGNTEWENDEAVIGWLYDDPNSLINARGRLRFDRAYTARLGFSFFLPGEIKGGLIIKYYDGQPFSRKIIVANLNQGPIFIQAFPRGIARYEFNLTADFRLEKSFTRGGLKSSLFMEGYNIFNLHQATEENEWTSPEFPLRWATEIQPPRSFRLGIKLEF
jgi:hypothetical protein